MELLLQVHQRKKHLQYLIESLTQTQFIETALVVFSHDFYSSEINEIIRNITSFRAIQVSFAVV